MHRLAAPLSAVAALITAASCADATDSASVPEYVLLDEAAQQLQDDFNRARGAVRLVFVVDPICPVCLRGMDDLNKALLARTSDPRLQTFVVHVSVLGGQAKDIPPAAKLLHNTHVRHYWNPSGAFGRLVTESVELKRSEDELVYAWDVWLIYGPEVTWDETLPPRPRTLMHQLPSLRNSKQFPRLDAGAFAREVRSLLEQLPALRDQS